MRNAGGHAGEIVGRSKSDGSSCSESDSSCAISRISCRQDEEDNVDQVPDMIDNSDLRPAVLAQREALQNAPSAS
jgi:hypothetical protein